MNTIPKKGGDPMPRLWSRTNARKSMPVIAAVAILLLLLDYGDIRSLPSDGATLVTTKAKANATVNATLEVSEQQQQQGGIDRQPQILNNETSVRSNRNREGGNATTPTTATTTAAPTTAAPKAQSESNSAPDGKTNTTATTTKAPKAKSEPETASASTPAPESGIAAISMPVIDYNYTFIRHHVDYKTSFPLPDWMEDFLSTQPTGDARKHHEMLTNPSNKFLVMTCYKFAGTKEEACGGLTDRLINLAYNMWVAHNTGRKLLIKYWKPRPLEEFLVPPPPSDHGFNWMLPDGYLLDEWYEYGNRTIEQYKDNRRWYPKIETLNEDAKFRDKRVIFLNNNLIGGAVIDKLEDWSDDLWQGLFLRFFQPSREIARRLNLVTDPLRLEAGKYSSAHVRAKFPLRLGSQSGYLKYVNKKWYHADKTPARLDMTNNQTIQVVSELGNLAVTCAVRVMPETKYVYVASDLREIIEYLKFDSLYWADNDTAKIAPKISWEAFDYEAALASQTNNNQTNNQTGEEAAAEAEAVSSAVHGWGVPSWEIPTTARVIARHDYNETADHFDNKRHPDPDPPSLMGAVVDYWMFAHALGHSIGVGGFGRFGSVVAGNNRDTRSRHRDYDNVSPSCATSNERKAWKALHSKTRRRTRTRRFI